MLLWFAELALLLPLLLALLTELLLEPSLKELSEAGNMELTRDRCRWWKCSHCTRPQSKLGGGRSPSHVNAPTICCRSTASRPAPGGPMLRELLVPSRFSVLVGVLGPCPSLAEPEPAATPEAALKPRRMLPPGVPGVARPDLPGSCT